MNDQGKTAWKVAYEFLDAKDSVQDIEFAPRQRGLSLVLIGGDGGDK